ncbi:conserved domain protein [Turicibacter sanguinis PC909]|uniref:Conserved domain protein n=1 Tax=Turicibacter sanguinis PC909 TaxID=702450 RepID=A0ABP2HYH1_9FIRM|nr:conserved domain protein [Turicibacter sanguinis PC909]
MVIFEVVSLTVSISLRGMKQDKKSNFMKVNEENGTKKF